MGIIRPAFSELFTIVFSIFPEPYVYRLALLQLSLYRRPYADFLCEILLLDLKHQKIFPLHDFVHPVEDDVEQCGSISKVKIC